MKIYISGKMRGLTESRIRHRFCEVAEYLRLEGYTPINPAVLMDIPNLEREDYLYIDLAMLSRCDAIYMLKGWEESEGAKLELKTAIESNKKIILEE